MEYKCPNCDGKVSTVGFASRQVYWPTPNGAAFRIPAIDTDEMARCVACGAALPWTVGDILAGTRLPVIAGSPRTEEVLLRVQEYAHDLNDELMILVNAEPGDGEYQQAARRAAELVRLLQAVATEEAKELGKAA